MEFGYQIYLQKKVTLLIQFPQILFLNKKLLIFFQVQFFL